MSQNNDKVDFAYQVLQGRHEAEIQRRQELDEKSDRLIQCVTIVVGITIALGTTSFRETLELWQLYVPYFVGIGFLILSIAIALFASNVMTWREAPDIRNLIKWIGNGKIPIDKMKVNIFFELEAAIEHNFKNNQRKAIFVIFSWGFMLAGLVTLVIFLGILVNNVTN